MRWVLAGGATLGGSKHDDERAFASRPLAAVVVRSIPRRLAPLAQEEEKQTEAVQQREGEQPVEKLTTQKQGSHTAAVPPPPNPPPQKLTERLSTVKLFLEVLAVLVGLISAILALLSGARK